MTNWTVHNADVKDAPDVLDEPVDARRGGQPGRWHRTAVRDGSFEGEALQPKALRWYECASLRSEKPPCHKSSLRALSDAAITSKSCLWVAEKQVRALPVPFEVFSSTPM